MQDLPISKEIVVAMILIGHIWLIWLIWLLGCGDWCVDWLLLRVVCCRVEVKALFASGYIVD